MRAWQRHCCLVHSGPRNTCWVLRVRLLLLLLPLLLPLSCAAAAAATALDLPLLGHRPWLVVVVVALRNGDGVCGKSCSPRFLCRVCRWVATCVYQNGVDQRGPRVKQVLNEAPHGQVPLPCSDTRACLSPGPERSVNRLGVGTSSFWPGSPRWCTCTAQSCSQPGRHA